MGVFFYCALDAFTFFSVTFSSSIVSVLIAQFCRCFEREKKKTNTNITLFCFLVVSDLSNGAYVFFSFESLPKMEVHQL